MKTNEKYLISEAKEIMKFKKDVKIYSDNFWYDLFEGGYIKPEKLLKNQKDIKKVNLAIATLKQFSNEAIKQNVVEEM